MKNRWSSVLVPTISNHIIFHSRVIMTGVIYNDNYSYFLQLANALYINYPPLALFEIFYAISVKNVIEIA